MDYRGLNEFVWEVYHRIYGGGPVLPRRGYDIYNPPTKTILLSTNVDLKYYINIEKTHKELIAKLVLERKKQKNIKNENEKTKVVKLNGSDENKSQGIIQNILSMFH